MPNGTYLVVVSSLHGLIARKQNHVYPTLHLYDGEYFEQLY